MSAKKDKTKEASSMNVGDCIRVKGGRVAEVKGVTVNPRTHERIVNFGDGFVTFGAKQKVRVCE